MKLCPHELTALYDPSIVPECHQDLAKLDIVLKGLADYRRCNVCHRIGFLGRDGWVRWLDAETQTRREQKLAEWHAHWQRLPARTPTEAP
jgi:hypothetical protein